MQPINSAQNKKELPPVRNLESESSDEIRKNVYIHFPVGWMRGTYNTAKMFISVVGIIGVGVWLHSVAMQWMGFIMLLAISYVLAGRQQAMTPQRAADFLKEKFGVVAK